MSIARHHVEWLSLLEVSGPFLSLPVLMKTFPQGLEGIEPHLVGSLRAGYEEWQAGVEKRTPSIQDDWVRFVLRDMLSIPDDAIEQGQAIPEAIRASFAEHGETLRPDLVITEPASKRRRLLIQVYPATQDLEKAVRGRTWNASPATRMMELLHATGVRLGLVTNGERWMLVDAPKDETTGYSSWYAGLWLEERITLQAFRSLLGVERFFNIADDQTLEALLTESAENQQEVTDQLGYQVRKAVEVLVEALDRADQDHGRALLKDVAETELYEAALTVMMRLVFLFCAEERELLLLGEPLFDEHYAVSTLREQLREAADQHGEDVLERRHDAWSRLLASFRAVHGGIRHERLVIPPYGGTLLDPDRFPFLEGRKRGTTWRTTPAEPLPVNNRTVLHLLDALQVLQVRLPGGGSAEARKLSFRALDIEQIGYVYEGLLDHTAVRATEPVLGLVATRNKTKDFEAEVPLSTLEALRKKGEKELVEYLVDQTGRSSAAIEKAVRRDFQPEELRRIQGACGSGSAGATLWNRLRPFAGLVRDDSFGYPLVIHHGSVYVTEGTDRRSSGTQYTPRSFTEPVVQHALEPLVYEGPAEGWPKEKWKLRSAREILALKICDLACGSGAFLVQDCRYLADRLIEAWAEVKRLDPTALRITPEGDVSQGLPEERLIPEDPDERLTFARRLVAQRCLYGVDVNPLAVEMAKLSLWLLTLAKDQPFTFFDHSIRCGDSLLGITSIDQLKRFSLAEGPVQKTISQTASFDAVIDDAIAKRLRLESIEGNSVEHVATQKHLLAEAEEGLAQLKAAADQLIGAEIGDVSRNDAIQAANSGLLGLPSESPAGERPATARPRRPFHWVLEFPEVIVKRGGFDGFAGNPPFIRGKLIGATLGSQYQGHLKAIFHSSTGAADLCAYFLRRACGLVNPHGMVGLIGTKTLAEGDTRDVGLRALCEDGRTIVRADHERPWPGSANVTVSMVYIANENWNGERILNGIAVAEINSTLDEGERAEPFALLLNQRLCSDGIKLQGDGFVISAGTKERLEVADPRNVRVLKPYVIGMDITQSVGQRSGNWVICFGTMTEREARSYTEPFRIVEEEVRPYRDGLSGQIHEKAFWRFWDKREEFFEKMRGQPHILACPSTSKYLLMTQLPSAWIPSHSIKLFAFSTFAAFAELQSIVHEVWARQQSGKLEARLAYNLSRAFATFPRLLDTEPLEQVGRDLLSARQEAEETLGLALTDLYNRVHQPNDSTPSVQRLRNAHEATDTTVLEAYGWSDVPTEYGFHETRQGVRFTISEAARRVVLGRLLKLNHERHNEEVRQGLHERTKGRKRRAAELGEGDEPSLF